MKKNKFSDYIKSFDFRTLFNDLGWNNFKRQYPVAVNDDVFELQGIAEKKGFVILHCPPMSNGKMPQSTIRRQIENRVTKHYFEHLIIYTDETKNQQIWQLAIKEENKPKQVREIIWYKHQDVEALFQRMKNILFTLEDEENITIVDVKQRISENFAKNSEQVTKRFYQDFKKQHSAFLDFITGIDDHIKNHKNNKSKQWYASLMLNRLMFCYFIQKKGFLNQDVHYLKNKLNECSSLKGNNNFYNFYRSFLLELFHDGLGKPKSNRKKDLSVDLGEIPYLNGGLFDVHELEKQFDNIQIDDKAFSRIFDFFDQWNWHLDNRIEATGKDINPDVIGYIFEKYINDRASMGAYYTKEDITDYIGKNTIIPFLFDETERHYKTPFETEIWDFIKNSNQTYIYDAVKYGIKNEKDLFGDLPESVKKGINHPIENKIVTASDDTHLWEMRKPWNKSAPEDIALPTETYRELIERRERFADILQKIQQGDIKSINDFITYNLDIRQFTQDFIETTDDPKFIHYFYKALNKITILDPTCGSGAFLFAALNILEPLYDACINRMEQFTAEQPKKYKYFEEVLSNINSDNHPNLKYFIFKSIILNNLYGVDIMHEAVEIAKLRLFLKLVATVDVAPRKPNYGLEPLPDIDFNIRAGNTLVGFATESDLLKTIEKKEGFFAKEKLEEFKEEFELVSKAFSHFQNSQLIDKQDGQEFKDAKIQLVQKLKTLNHRLNTYLATNYGIDEQRHQNNYAQWLESHQPFHWFAEFYQIIHDKGGFDIVIGNPPYLEIKQINYEVINLNTRPSNAVHSMCIEQSIKLLNEKGAISMIVPLALVSTQRMLSAQNLIEKNRSTWYSNFSWRPGKLFDQVNRALTIFISNHGKNDGYSTGYLKWNAEHRDYLFPTINYTSYNNQRYSFWFPKLSSVREISILQKVLECSDTLSDYKGKSEFRIYYRTTGGLYWKVFTNYSPKFFFNGVEGKSSRETSFSVLGKNTDKQIVGLLSSSTFWIWYSLTSNLRDLNPSDINEFRFSSKVLKDDLLLEISKVFLNDLDKNSTMLQREQKNKGLTETQSFKISKSKSIINQIDTVLAEHYGFTETELDYIINYDIKYRMGKNLNE